MARQPSCLCGSPSRRMFRCCGSYNQCQQPAQVEQSAMAGDGLGFQWRVPTCLLFRNPSASFFSCKSVSSSFSCMRAKALLHLAPRLLVSQATLRSVAASAPRSFTRRGRRSRHRSSSSHVDSVFRDRYAFPSLTDWPAGAPLLTTHPTDRPSPLPRG